MFKMILLICLANQPNCNEQNALQIIQIPLQQLAINCGFEAQSYITHNGINVEGVVWRAKCKN